jgi:hypothetical protein
LNVTEKDSWQWGALPLIGRGATQRVTLEGNAMEFHCHVSAFCVIAAHLDEEPAVTAFGV